MEREDPLPRPRRKSRRPTRSFSPNSRVSTPLTLIPPTPRRGSASFGVFICSATILFKSTQNGLIKLVITDDPTPSYAWKNVASHWREFRVTSVLVRFLPCSKSPESGVPGFGVSDPQDSSLPLSSADEACGRFGSRMLSLLSPWTMELQKIMDDGAYFDLTSEPLSRASIKFFFEFLAPSTTYGRLYVTYVVELRYAE